MRVGVYVDGYNLYYGGKSLCEPTDHWKWFSPRRIAQVALDGQIAFAHSNGHNLIANTWQSAEIVRVVYCTARVSGIQTPSAATDQSIYLQALNQSNAVDHIEYGNYVTRIKHAPLATKGSGKMAPPVVTQADWPVKIRDGNRKTIEDATFLVSHLHTEEKGSDVNVATHLLVDTFNKDIDAAIVISNDSDLSYPISVARGLIPVGVVNPSKGMTAGKLRLPGTIGSTYHWVRKLTRESFLSAQMPEKTGSVKRPSTW